MYSYFVLCIQLWSSKNSFCGCSSRPKEFRVSDDGVGASLLVAGRYRSVGAVVIYYWARSTKDIASSTFKKKNKELSQTKRTKKADWPTGQLEWPAGPPAMAASMRGSVVARQNHCDRSLGMDGQTRSSDQRQTNSRQRNNADTWYCTSFVQHTHEKRKSDLRPPCPSCRHPPTSNPTTTTTITTVSFIIM